MNARLRRPAVALLATALAASVLGVAPAAYAADGTISGTVSGPGGGIAYAYVTFYRYDAIDDEYFYEDYATAGPTGVYSKALAPGSYKIGFDDYSGGDHVGEYYDDAVELEDADPVVVPDGGSAPAADAVLAPASHITGTVTGPVGPLEDVYVTAYRAYDDQGGISYEQVSGASTDAFGSYDIGRLPAGTYRIRFGDEYFEQDYPTDYATEWYVNRPSLYSATNVPVPPVDTVENIDAQLALDGEIAGDVIDVDNLPLENVDVDAYVLDDGDWVSVSETSTDEFGHYVLDGLAAGTYRVGFRDYSSDEPIREYWNNKGLLANAANVVVGQVTVNAIDARMVAGEHDAETAPTVVNTALPTISGSPVVGSTLTASTGSWSTAPDEFYYDWLRDGQFIDGANGVTHVPTAADIGKRISVLVTAGAPLHEYGHAESAPTAPVTATAPVVTPPVVTTPAPVVDVPTALAKALAAVKVTGKPKVGKTLKVANLDLDVRAAVTYRFQWFAGTKKIKKATKAKLKVIEAMKGKKLSVKVTGAVGATTKSVKIKVGKVR